MRPVSSLRAPAALRAGIVVLTFSLFGSGAALGQQPRPGDVIAAPAPPAMAGQVDAFAAPAPLYEAGGCDPYALDNSCCADACYDPSWLEGCYGFVRLGGGKISAPLVDGDGFNWSVGAVLPIHDTRLAPIVAFDALHDASTQSLTSAGITWQPDVWSCSHLDRIGVAVLVQNYDDSLFRGIDVWRSNIDISYAVTPELSVGYYRYDRIDEAEVDFSTNPAFAAVFDTRMSDVRGGYISHTIGPINWTFRAADGNRPDGWRIGGSVILHVRDDVSVYVSADRHEEEQWGAIAGMQYHIFPDRHCCR
jgi:hypothetical protein